MGHDTALSAVASSGKNVSLRVKSVPSAAVCMSTFTASTGDSATT